MFSSLSSKCLQIWICSYPINNAGTIRPLSDWNNVINQDCIPDMNPVFFCRCSNRLNRNTARGQLKLGILLLLSTRAGFQSSFLSWIAFFRILITAWKTGQCLTHPHRGELHLVRYKIMLDCRLWSCISKQVPLYMVEAKSSKATQRFSREGTLPFWHIRCSVSIRCLGERWRMVVPPHLAYGDSGAGDSIPGWLNIWTPSGWMLPWEPNDADLRWS